MLGGDVVTLGAIAPSQLIEAPGRVVAEFEGLGEVVAEVG